MMNPKSTIHWMGRKYVTQVLISERSSHAADPRGSNERPIEYAYALEQLRLSPHQDVLDVGTGLSPWPSLLQTCGYSVRATDDMGTYWRGAVFNRHIYVERHDITQGPMKDSFGNITCLSVLEHIPNSTAAVKSMSQMLKSNGRLILTFPYNEKYYIADAYKLASAGYGRGNPYVAQVYNRAKIDEWLLVSSLRISDQRYFSCFTGTFWTEGKRLQPMLESDRMECHLTCLTLTHS